MVDLYKQIDFSQEVDSNKELQKFLKQAANEIYAEQPVDQVKKPILESSCDNFVIVIGLPITEEAKIDKLLTAFNNVVIKKHLMLEGELQKIDMGRNPDKSGNGCAVIEFSTAAVASDAQIKLNGLDFFQNILYAYTIEEYDFYCNLKPEFEAPKYKSRKQLNNWLTDKHRREQILLRTNNVGQLSWFFHIKKVPELENNSLPFEPDTRLDYSRTGAYLVSISKNGFKLYGGDQMELLGSFEHPQVKKIEFSPNDKYILSFNGTVVDAPDQRNYIVWNVDSRVRLRIFTALQEDIWGTFKWSYDAQYLAQVGQNMVSVYDMPSVKLNNEASLKIPGVQKCIWVDKLNMLCSTVYAGNLREREDRPQVTKFFVHLFPDRNEIRWKNANFEVSDLDLFSHEYGTWICAVLKKVQKKKKFLHIQLAVNNKKTGTFDVSDKDYKDCGDKIHGYSCETKYGRLGLVFKSDKNHMYKIVLNTFEEDSSKSLGINEAGRFEDKRANEVIWARNGIFFALVNRETGPYMGVIEFGYLYKNKDQRFTAELIFETELPYMSFCQWDPSGRLFLIYSQQTQTYEIWTPMGQRMFKDTLSGGEIEYLSWRPRPINILEEKEEKDIFSKYNEYKQLYEEEDDKIINAQKYERETRRKEMGKFFDGILEQNRKEWEASKPERVKLRGFDEEYISDGHINETIENEYVIETVTIPQNNK